MTEEFPYDCIMQRIFTLRYAKSMDKTTENVLSQYSLRQRPSRFSSARSHNGIAVAIVLADGKCNLLFWDCTGLREKRRARLANTEELTAENSFSAILLGDQDYYRLFDIFSAESSGTVLIVVSATAVYRYLLRINHNIPYNLDIEVVESPAISLCKYALLDRCGELSAFVHKDNNIVIRSEELKRLYNFCPNEHFQTENSEKTAVSGIGFASKERKLLILCVESGEILVR